MWDLMTIAVLHACDASQIDILCVELAKAVDNSPRD